MQQLIQYRESILADVDLENTETGEGRSATFTNLILAKLVEYEKIDEYNISFFETSTNRGRRLRVDAYYFDEIEENLFLYVTDFGGSRELSRITNTEANLIFERLITFIELAYSGKLDRYVDISDRIHACINEIRNKFGIIKKFKLNIITDKVLSDRALIFESKTILDKEVEHAIWDINRILLMESANDIDDDYIVNVSRPTSLGIKYIEIENTSELEIKNYLGVISGEVLADVFDQYGSKILESNVRSFLSAKGKVNSGIRATILNNIEKRKFFAYNNGISITTSKIHTINVEGQNYITGLERMQIVNGGQTTASLSSARFKDKADLEGIFLQVKITEIEDSNKIEVVRNISKYSNSQNKVTDADFYSTSEFAIRMEQHSRRIFAPAINGNQYETHWFYERAKGQYFLAQSRMSKIEIKKFIMQNPKSQLLTKTNIGTYRNIWEGRPHIAKRGAEKSLKYFIDIMSKQWDKDHLVFNELYFKETVAIGILYRKLNKAILKEAWYRFGYAAEVTIYTLALLAFIFDSKNEKFDLLKIWNNQTVDLQSFSVLLELSEVVYRKICEENRPISNISEWCKKEACWEEVKKINYPIEIIINNYKTNKFEIYQKQKDAKDDMKLSTEINVQSKVIEAGAEFWKRVAIFAIQKKLLDEKEMSILETACKMNHIKIPTDRQSQIIMKIYNKCILEGYEEII